MDCNTARETGNMGGDGIRCEGRVCGGFQSKTYHLHRPGAPDAVRARVIESVSWVRRGSFWALNAAIRTSFVVHATFVARSASGALGSARIRVKASGAILAEAICVVIL